MEESPLFFPIARVLEQLLETLEQMPSPTSQSIAPRAPETVPLHERVSLALQRCQKALLAQSAVLWRWTPQYNALSLVASDGVPPEQLEADADQNETKDGSHGKRAGHEDIRKDVGKGLIDHSHETRAPGTSQGEGRPL
jgi:hypothetical protein